MGRLTLYKAKIIDKAGAQILVLAAESEAQALLEAEKAGKVIYCKRHYDFSDFRTLTSDEREQFLSQLSFLTSSGVGTGEALRILQANHSGRIESLAGELLMQIEFGLDLSTALSLTGVRDFPPASLALIAAGYRSGDGPQALKAAAEFEADMRALTADSSSELMSALMGFVAAIGCTLLSVFYLGPNVLSSELTKVAGGVDVAWAMSMGYVLGGVMCAMVLLLLALVVIRYALRGMYPGFSDMVTQAIPLWSDLALSKERFLAFFSLQVLSAPNISLEHAFEVTARGVAPGVLRNELEAARQAIQKGQEWVPALGCLSPIDRAALSVAGDRRQLAEIFGKLSLQYKGSYAKSKRFAASALKLIAAVALTLSGGLLFALTILPMLQAVQSILT